MLQVSYCECELLGDSPSCFLKAKLVYLHYTRAILSHTSWQPVEIAIDKLKDVEWQ